MNSDPRRHLLEADALTVRLGEIDADGLGGGHRDILDRVRKRLTREQSSDYRQALREGFCPVLVVDLETSVTVLEMRRHL